MPVVYEVNIDVEPSIGDKYLSWLRLHVEEMKTQLHGIQRVSVCLRDAAADGWIGYTVSYTVESREQVEDYLTNRAAAMRQQGLDAFGTSFRATRRIMNVVFEK